MWREGHFYNCNNGKSERAIYSPLVTICNSFSKAWWNAISAFKYHLKKGNLWWSKREGEELSANAQGHSALNLFRGILQSSTAWEVRVCAVHYIEWTYLCTLMVMVTQLLPPSSWEKHFLDEKKWEVTVKKDSPGSSKLFSFTKIKDKDVTNFTSV